MSKSNPVHLWRFGRTGALIFTLKWLNRAKTGMLHGTPKIFPGLGQGVSRVNKTQVARINWKIKSILSGLVTRRLYFLKKYDTKWAFFPPCRNWPICVGHTAWARFVFDMWFTMFWDYIVTPEKQNKKCSTRLPTIIWKAKVAEQNFPHHVWEKSYTSSNTRPPLHKH